MKRILSLILVFMLTAAFLPFYPTASFAAESVAVLMQIDNPYMLVNGTSAEIDPGRGTCPVISSDRTIVPIRAIIEAFSGNVEWNGDERKVTLTYYDDKIELIIDSYTAYLNGEERVLDAAPQIIGGRTLLPIRFVAESFGLDVFWHGEHSVIALTNYGGSQSAAVPDMWKKSSYTLPLRVHFIDVGQGDSIFAELPNGQTLLIDAGPSENTTLNYIKALGYGKIDYVVATHPDADHITGMPKVLDNLQVGTFYMPDKPHTTQIYERMLDSLLANGCSCVYASAGVTPIAENDLYICFVAPNRVYSDNNEASAVVKLVYRQNSFLFTGDAEGASEVDMISAGHNLKADVLKVGHHGSNSSTSAAFLQKVNPKYAVISAGADNRYGHPTDAVLSLLNSYGIVVYRTDLSGTIVVACDGINYDFNKIKSEYVPDSAPAVNEGASAESTPQQSVQVYKTKTGSKYHLDGCTSLKSKIPVTVEQAKSEGLTPCAKCNPPV